MNVIKEGTPEWLPFVFVALLIAISTFCLVVMDLNNYVAQQKHDAAPCSTFKQDTLSELPARCITKQGGFNQ